jgi:hypothetical protein
MNDAQSRRVVHRPQTQDISVLYPKVLLEQLQELRASTTSSMVHRENGFLGNAAARVIPGMVTLVSRSVDLLPDGHVVKQRVDNQIQTWLGLTVEDRIKVGTGRSALSPADQNVVQQGRPFYPDPSNAVILARVESSVEMGIQHIQSRPKRAHQDLASDDAPRGPEGDQFYEARSHRSAESSIDFLPHGRKR